MKYAKQTYQVDNLEVSASDVDCIKQDIRNVNKTIGVFNKFMLNPTSKYFTNKEFALAVINCNLEHARTRKRKYEHPEWLFDILYEMLEVVESQ